ncbi:MAG: ABC transporter substrate-binding protein [Cyanobacteria bacterium P01_D01_bin.36]
MTGLILSGIASSCQAIGSTTEADTESEAPGTTEITVARNNKTLLMATTANYPPYQQTVENNRAGNTEQDVEIVGFDIDLAQLIAERLNRELAIVDLEFGALIPAVMNEEVDIAMAAIAPNRNRKQKVDFSNIYYRSRHALVSLDGYLEADDLSFQTIGLISNSVQARYADTLSETFSIDIVTYETIEEIFEALDMGAITGALIEATVAASYLRRYPDFAAQIMPSDGPSGSAIAIAKNSPLRREINAAITDIKASGEMDQLIAQWFS